MSEDTPSHPSLSLNGLSLRLIHDFIEENGGKIAFLGKKTFEVTVETVIPLTKDRCLSYVEYLIEKKPILLQEGHIRQANYFISHAWMYNFLDVVDALDEYFQEHCRAIDNMDAVVIWFDIFTNNQNIATNLPFEWWKKTFFEAIKAFGNIIMVLMPWEDPATLKR